MSLSRVTAVRRKKRPGDESDNSNSASGDDSDVDAFDGKSKRAAVNGSRKRKSNDKVLKYKRACAVFNSPESELPQVEVGTPPTVAIVQTVDRHFWFLVRHVLAAKRGVKVKNVEVVVDTDEEPNFTEKDKKMIRKANKKGVEPTWIETVQVKDDRGTDGWRPDPRLVARGYLKRFCDLDLLKPFRDVKLGPNEWFVSYSAFFDEKERAMNGEFYYYIEDLAEFCKLVLDGYVHERWVGHATDLRFQTKMS